MLAMVLCPLHNGKTSFGSGYLFTCKQCLYKRMLHLQLVPAPFAGTLGRHIFQHGSDSSLAARFHVGTQLFQGPPHPPWPWTSMMFLCLL